MNQRVKVEVTRRVSASPERTFDAWLDPASARRWLFATDGGVMEACEIEPHVGGRFQIVERRGEALAEHFGEFVELERPRRLAFDFWTSFSDVRTRVTVTVAPDGDGSIVTLTHEGVWPDYEAKTQQGWSTILDRMAASVEQ